MFVPQLLIPLMRAADALRTIVPPSIVFGAVKKIEVEMDGGNYREVEKKAGLTFKEVVFGMAANLHHVGWLC